MAEGPDRDARSLTVEVATVRFRTAEDDFGVLAAVTDDGDEVTVTGPVGHLHPGESAELRGRWRRHAKHGWQFHVDGIRMRQASSEPALLAYLGAVRHIGPKGAAWLLERHGAEDVLSAIDADPAKRLGEVPGVGRAKLRSAVASWEEQIALRSVRLFLEEHGVPAAVAARIYRHLGPDAMATLQGDPYRLTEVSGIGFATADALAMALGTPLDAPGRLDAGIVHVLREAEDDGHCFLPREELLERARRLLQADVEDRVDGLAARGLIELEDGRVAEASMAATERTLARRVRELLDDGPALRLKVPERPTDGEFVPTEAQWAVVAAALASRLSILTGGPGVGKTASMTALVELVLGAGRTVRLCAPTGKAARRLTELTGAEATTIHRLLEWIPGEGFGRGPEDPIPGADLLIVDEASMLDVRLAAALLKAVGPRTHVLLVGDVDQLAPVGPGRVLEDLIDAGRVPVTRLSEIFRQAARSMIVRAAHDMNAGRAPRAEPGPGEEHDFFVIERRGADEIAAEVVGLAADRLPRHYGLDPIGAVQVLAPMYRGPAGIDALNDALRARLNPDGQAIAGTAFRVGDRVIQTRNSYELDLFNGELGVLVSVDRQRGVALFAGDDGRRVRVPAGELATFRHAYAVSVHRAQGSECPVVVLPVFGGHRMMLTRNLLYTAATRARQVLVLVGEPGVLAQALGRLDARTRYTRLTELVAG